MTRQLVAVALAAVGCVGLSMPVQTQKTLSSQGWQFNLSLPQRNQASPAGNEGMSWDQVRSVGLTLSARGWGELSVGVTILKVKSGRVNGRWQSRGCTTASGGRAVPDAYLPSVGVGTLPSLGRVA